MVQKSFMFMPSQDLKFIISNIDDFLRNNPEKRVSLIIFKSNRDISQIFEDRTIKGFKFSYDNGKGGFGVFNIYRKDKKIENLVIKIPNSDLVLLLNFENLAVMRWMGSFFLRLYGDFSKSAFTSKELKEILLNLESVTKGKINSRKVIYKKLIKVPNKGNKRFKRVTDVNYTDEEFIESFDGAMRNNQFIDKIEFELNRDSKSVLKGYLSREGIFKFSGNFSLFFNSLIKDYLKNLEEKKINFLNKHISKIFDGQVKSFKLKFEYSIFEKVEKNKEFIDAIGSMKKSLMVVHHGNPYVHLSVLDYLDGSSFDLISMEKDSIRVISKDKSSISSISRLLNHIFENFSEGAVADVGLWKKEKRIWKNS